MTTETAIVDLIDRANDATPFCPCGSHTTPVWRDGIVWLDCASLVEPAPGALRRLLQVLAPHVHEVIVNLRDEELIPAA